MAITEDQIQGMADRYARQIVVAALGANDKLDEHACETLFKLIQSAYASGARAFHALSTTKTSDDAPKN